MTQVLTLKLNDNIFTIIQQRAESMGISPELLSANILEQQFEQTLKQTLDKTEKQLARKRFENHFGEIGISYQIDISNESIDADLARAYAHNNEDV